MFNHRLNKLITSLSLGMVFTVIAGVNSASLAQSQSSDNNSYQSNEKSTVFGDTPSGLNPLDLMHRAQQLNGRSAAEFDADSQGQLDNSVSDFKKLQQQRILQQQQVNPTEDNATSEDTLQ